MTSICIYGSEARRTRDAYSDRDVLLSTGSSGLASDTANFLRMQGWAVNEITYDKLEEMASRGDLFVHHLKTEGVIIKDDGCNLQRILSNTAPARINVLNAAHDIAFIQSIQLPRSEWGAACIADIFYVFIRNAAINICFHMGQHIFDYKSTIENLVSHSRLNSNDIISLQNLRVLKSYYRTRHMQRFSIDFYLLKSAISKIEATLPSINSLEVKRSAYQKLRAIELELVEKFSVDSLDSMSESHPHYDIWKLIKNPGSYPDIQTVTERWHNNAI